MKRLTIEEWKTVFSNLKDNEEVDVVWLDGTNEYILCFEYEVFEDGFKTEKEALERINHIEYILKPKIVRYGMSKQEKVEFINSIIEVLRKQVLSNVDKMPEEWDGKHIREYVKAKAEDLTWRPYMLTRKEKRDFNNEVITRGL